MNYNIRYASFQMDMLVLVAMETCASMDEYGRHKLRLVSHAEDSIESAIAAMLGVCHGRNVSRLGIMAIVHARPGVGESKDISTYDTAVIILFVTYSLGVSTK